MDRRLHQIYRRREENTEGKIAAKKARDDPETSTRGQLAKKGLNPVETTGRINKEETVLPGPSSQTCDVIFTDVIVLIKAAGRCRDGSDDRLVFKSLVERAALCGIGKISKIKLITMKVAIRKGGSVESFKISK